jgi:hypothetical protein
MICANFIGPTGQQHNRQAPTLSRGSTGSPSSWKDHSNRIGPSAISK